MKIFSYVLGVVGTIATAGLFAAALGALPPPGGVYTGYAELATRVLVEERHVANTISGVLLDMRPLDTLFEELVLYATVIGLAVLVREKEEEHRPNDEPASMGVRFACAAMVPVFLVLGLEIATFGHLSPGGGFQGGVALSSVFLLVYFAGRLRAFHAATEEKRMDAVEAIGVLGLLGVGLAGLATGALYSAWLPRGELHSLPSAGNVPIGNLAAMLAVAIGATLVVADFSEALRRKRQEKRGTE